VRLTMEDLHRVASRLGLKVVDGPKSQCWALKKLIHLGSKHRNNPHVLAHEIAHCINDGRASWRLYHKRGRRSLALRCEETICDTVADTITGMRRYWLDWDPVTGRAAHYCAVKAQVVINRIMEVQCA